MEVKNIDHLLKKEREDYLMPIYIPACFIEFPFINAII